MPKLSEGGILVCTCAIHVFALRTSHAPEKRVNVNPQPISRRAGDRFMRFVHLVSHASYGITEDFGESLISYEEVTADK